MADEEEEEHEGEEQEGKEEDAAPAKPQIPVPGAEDQFEQLNELLRNNQVCHSRLPMNAAADGLVAIKIGLVARHPAHRRPQPHCQC